MPADNVMSGVSGNHAETLTGQALPLHEGWTSPMHDRTSVGLRPGALASPRPGPFTGLVEAFHPLLK